MKPTSPHSHEPIVDKIAERLVRGEPFVSIAAESLRQSHLTEEQSDAYKNVFGSEQLLQRLIMNSADCILILDEEGRVLAMNSRGHELLGIADITPFLHSFWPDWWKEKSAQKARTALEDARLGKVTTFEAKGDTFAENAQWWSVTVTPLADPESQPERFLVMCRDISERKRVRTNLQASEERFRVAFEQSIMGLVISDSKGIVLRANEAFCRIVGHSMESVMGRTSHHMTHPDDRQNNVNSLEKLESGELSNITFQKRYIRADGETVWTQINVSKIADSGIEPGGLIATIEDITEQVHVRKALQEREQHLRLIFESVKDYAIFTIDPKGVVTEWNAGAERVFGYSAAEVVGRDSTFLWTKEDQAAGIPAEELAHATLHGFWEGERWQQRKNGSVFFASGTLRPMQDEFGELRGFTKVCQDVTTQRESTRQLAEARMQIAETLEQERERLADVFKRSPSFMAILRGPDHVFELVNDEFLRVIGTRDLLNKTFAEAIPEVADQGFPELLENVYRSGEPFVGKDITAMVRRYPDQPLVTCNIDFVYQPTHDFNGNINGIFIHGIDQTDRKIAEDALQQVAEQRRVALDAADMGWWQLEIPSGKVFIDDRVKSILGAAPDEELDLEMILEKMLPEDRENVRTNIAAALDINNTKPYFVEYRVLHKDGKMLWIQSKGRAYFKDEPTRHAVRLVGTAMDVTEIKLAQERLLKSEARFRQLSDALPQIVFMAQPDGNVDYFNQQWYNYTGLEQGGVGYEHWKHVHEEGNLDRATAAWMESVNSGSPYEIEYRIKRADGVFRWHLGRALPIRNEQGEIVRWFGTNTDIHDYKELQVEHEKLLSSERSARSDAERANHIKDEFLATLSHELRTPLNAILGWCSILGREPDPRDLGEGLEVIERNARAQAQIIEDLLDMSAIISGKVRLNVQRMDLAPVVKTAVETIRPAAEAKGVRLQIVLDPLARTVSGDPNRLQQVFWNLLSNAVKFTPKGGRIQVLLERVNSHLEVTISDTGEGISAEFLPWVFDRFRQADASITRRHGGLGLGLAIVKQLVELHGGSVRVKSGGQSQGSTFIVALPLTVLHIEPHAEPDRRHPQAGVSNFPLTLDHLHLKDLKVVVVDDEPDARALVRRFLEDYHALVRVAASAEEAMTLISTEKPDVLICDIGMPGEDGYSLIKRVRALPPEEGGAVPAIALTAYARSEDRMKAIVSGFQMHVAKPAEAAELLTMVASLSGRMSV